MPWRLKIYSIFNSGHMKKILILFVMILFCSCKPQPATAQAQEIAQLILNIEKLSQFKQILEDLKKGYDILYKGYNTIKNISEGNFKLHKGFLDALMKVSPTVRNYHKVTGIIDMQIALIVEYKTAFGRFRNEGNFSCSEISHMEKVYSNLVSLSLRSLDELATVITADKLRMSDNERLSAIDEIFDQMQDKLVFLRHFNADASVLSAQRAKEKHDATLLKTLEGIEP
jgi:DNA repair ATPase RecN